LSTWYYKNEQTTYLRLKKEVTGTCHKAKIDRTIYIHNCSFLIYSVSKVFPRILFYFCSRNWQTTNQ